MKIDEALKIIEQERLDMLTEGMSANEANEDFAQFVLLDEYKRLRAHSCSEYAALKALNAELIAALEALIEGRPTDEPPTISKIAHRNWELFQQARAALAKAKE